MNQPIGIVGYGLYFPSKKMTAADIAAATAGQWSEKAVIEKLGIIVRIPANVTGHSG